VGEGRGLVPLPRDGPAEDPIFLALDTLPSSVTRADIIGMYNEGYGPMVPLLHKTLARCSFFQPFRRCGG
jgi:hypothetical protein